MTKNSVCRTPYLRNHTSYDCHLWCKCVKWYLQVFFSILKSWFSRAERAKNDQNDKNFFLLHLIFQEPYIIWFSFMLHMHVWMENFSRHFCFFQNFDFQDHFGKRAKNDLKLPISVYYALHLSNCRSYHWDFDNDIYMFFFIILIVMSRGVFLYFF